jgi:urease accessory protein
MAASPWHGKLGLRFRWQSGQTQQIITEIQAPLKIQCPFYPEGSAHCHSTILHTAGGLVGGDRLSLNLHLEPQAQVLLTTVAASKVYGNSEFRIPNSTQQIYLKLTAQAHLEWLPQETIVFQGARYHQILRVDLEPGATWLGWEMTRLGRTARGEQFLAGDWRSDTQVWQQGKPLWIDCQWIPGNAEIWHSVHGLHGQPIVATLAFLGRSVEPSLVDQVRGLWHSCQSQPFQNGLERFPETVAEAGVTRLPLGLLCRYRGSSMPLLKQWFIAVWNQIRLTYQERPAHLPRVWPI